MTLRGRAANGRVSGAYRGAIDFRAGHVLGRRRGQLAPARQLPARRRAGRVAAVVADRGAQGAGRRGPHLRGRDDEARRRASTSTPTRARRSTAASRPRRPRPTRRSPRRAARSSPTTAQPVVTFFFSTSGGRTEDVENTPLGNEPRPWLKSVDDPYDDTSPRHRWGPIRMSAQAGRRASSARCVKGTFRGIEVVRRGRSPRIVEADVIGTRGRTRVTGGQLRARFGLFDSWAFFTSITTGDEPPPEDARGAGPADRRHRARSARPPALRHPAGRRGRRARAAGAARRRA